MKILHIGKFYPPYFGGIEKVNYDIVEGLNAKGIQTDVLCSNHIKGDTFSEIPYKIYRTHTLKVIASTPLRRSGVAMARQTSSPFFKKTTAASSEQKRFQVDFLRRVRDQNLSLGWVLSSPSNSSLKTGRYFECWVGL